MDYAVTFGDTPIGKVNVTRQGLYYRVLCRCRLTGDVLCRLEARCGERRVNLGILVPEENGFGLETRIPVSRLGEGTMTFCVLPRGEPAGERIFAPIYPEEPFAYLSRLKDAFLEIREGQKGASIPQEKRTELP